MFLPKNFFFLVLLRSLHCQFIGPLELVLTDLLYVDLKNQANLAHEQRVITAQQKKSKRTASGP